jgi:hypothetical protein
MKSLLRILVTVCSLIGSINLALANGVIARVVDPAQIPSIASDYPHILNVEKAGLSPFVRFGVSPANMEALELALEQDLRIVWIEEEEEFDSPENQSSRGSSVAAIYDRTVSFAQNTGIWRQINLSGSTRRLMPIRVGIVDTGISRFQPSIRRNVVASASFVPGSPTIDDVPTNLDTNLNGQFDEGAGHGTMVAGIILQIVPNTRLVVAKSADSDGIGTSWSVMKGVVFCVENGAKVINVSLGSPNHLAGFSEFLDWVSDSGSIIVSPIGNNGLKMTLFPAGYSSVICCTGLLPNNTKAPFSNWESKAVVSAPATGILSAWHDGGTAVWSGTSFTAPLVTGCIAAGLSFKPFKTPSQIKAAVKNSGRNIDGSNQNYRGQLGKLLDFKNLMFLLGK